MPIKITRRKGRSKRKTQAALARAKQAAEDHPAKPLGGRGRWVMTEGGEFREGSAGPELPPPQLRALPGELVTKDAASPNQAHVDDPEHIVGDIVYQAAKREREDALPPSIAEALRSYEAPIGEVVPLTQQRIDLVRFRLAQARLARFEGELSRGRDVDLFEPVHVWFPCDNVNHYELRNGHPPPDRRGNWPSGRPKHLLRFALEVDVLSPPRSIRDTLAEMGIVLTDHKDELINGMIEAHHGKPTTRDN